MQNRFILYGIGVIFGVIVLMVILDRKKENQKAAPGETKIDQLAPYFNADWSKNEYWDNNKTEIAVYEMKADVAVEYTQLTKKEIFNNEFMVATKDTLRTDRYEVMKMNTSFTIPSKNGIHLNYASSVFTLLKNPLLLVKLSTSTQDSEGNTFKSFLNKEKLFEMDYNSYQNNEGKGSRMIPNTVLFEDQLPFTLRTLHFAPELSFKQKVMETQLSNKVGDLVRYNAQFSIVDADSCWKVLVQLDSVKSNEYYFKKEYPNVMISKLSWDGTQLKLKQVTHRN